MCFGLESSPRLQYKLSKVNYSPIPWGLVSHLSTYKSPLMPHVSSGWGGGFRWQVIKGWSKLILLEGKITAYLCREVTASEIQFFAFETTNGGRWSICTAFCFTAQFPQIINFHSLRGHLQYHQTWSSKIKSNHVAKFTWIKHSGLMNFVMRSRTLPLLSSRDDTWRSNNWQRTFVLFAPVLIMWSRIANRVSHSSLTLLYRHFLIHSSIRDSFCCDFCLVLLLFPSPSCCSMGLENSISVLKDNQVNEKNIEEGATLPRPTKPSTKPSCCKYFVSKTALIHLLTAYFW